MGVNHSIEKIGDVTAAAIEKTGRDSVESVTAKIEENINNLLKTLQPLFKSAETPLVVAGIITSGVGFAAASASLFRSYQVLTGTDATSALLKLGVSIDKSLRTAADNLEAMNARQCQREFHKHVYQYVNMMSHGASPDTYFFVFHPGTDWYPAFHKMNTERPLARFADYFSNFNTMHVYLNVFRKAAGPILFYSISGWMKGVLASLLFKEGLNLAKKIALIVCYGFAVVELLCWYGTGPGLGL